MRIIKKFDLYVKENLQDDSNLDSLDHEADLETFDQDSFDDESGEFDEESEFLSPSGDILDREIDLDEENFNNDSEEDLENEDDSEEEEEAHEYMGSQLMNQLADKLGTTVENNAIVYNNKTINYYSETEAFHVDGKKFDSMDEVLEYLTSDGEVEDES